jgi:uncharacterized membrane protein
MSIPLHAEDLNLLHRLRSSRRKHRAAPPAAVDAEPGLTLGARVSDRVASVVGSWKFIIIQSVILVIWMVLNVTGFIFHWDPYPFILLNLVLSFQAAYTAPVIMMSQNRQSEVDRRAAQHDYEVNLKAELEIELLHQKIDLLRETELTQLTEIVTALRQELETARTRSQPPSEYK